jgi:excinuclease UvrABC helicase subunit UvrB
MIRELGYRSGIENYCHLDGREMGTRPYYFVFILDVITDD